MPLPLSITVLVVLFASGQTIANPKPSQHGTVSQRIAGTTITIEYNRPVARGRELFGKLVPYGRVWCPCADDATTIEVSTAVKVDGHDLPAGRYSIWTEPGPERWMVMFSKSAAAWHTTLSAPVMAKLLMRRAASGGGASSGRTGRG